LRIYEIVTPKDATVELIDALKLLAPFGTDNPVPQFLFRQTSAENVKRIGTAQQHLKLTLVDDGAQLDAVAFGFGSEENELLNNPIDVVGKLSVNEWNGRKKPQLMVTDFGVNGFQIFDWRSKRYRTLTEFKEDIFYLAFEKNSLKELNKEIREKIILFENLEKTKELIEGKAYHALLLVDCPTDLLVLEEILTFGSFDRMYLLGVSYDEAYLNGVGTREQYAKLFKLIHTQDKIDIRYKLEAISTYL